MMYCSSLRPTLSLSQCEINMQGVSSSAYRPGRLSQRKEAGLDRFITWYIDTMKAGVKKDMEAQHK
jgi:hypothetical protein